MKLKAKKSYMRKQNAQYTEAFEEVPRSEWPADIPERLDRAYRSCQFFVQVYDLPDGVIRLTVCRTVVDGDNWAAEISWDSLQDIKRRLGYGDCYAIEIYPRDIDLVNVAAMRHLWVLPEPLHIGWFRSGGLRGELTNGAIPECCGEKAK